MKDTEIIISEESKENNTVNESRIRKQYRKNRILRIIPLWHPLLLVLLMCTLCLTAPQLAAAVENNNPAVDISSGSLVLTGNDDGTNLQYKVGSENAKDYTGTITVSGGTIDFPIDSTITVESGSHTISLNGVNINVSGTDNACAFKIADDNTGNVTVILADDKTNILKSGVYCAGLQKNGAGAGIGTLTVKGGTKGTGTLTATGGEKFGAGIGSGVEYASRNITIEGGSVTATGGNNAAGIGGGDSGEGSYITITGGSVTATGGNFSAGIGGGSFVAGSNISITGGNVTATGGSGGAGIGGGSTGAGSNITIAGGSVKAIAGKDANAIGGGNGMDAVTPKNGTQSDAENVYLTTITVQDASDKPVKDTFLKFLTVSDKYTYGMTDVKTDSYGKIYVYLPAGKIASLTVDSDNKIYHGSVKAQNDNNGAGILQYSESWIINDNSLQLRVDNNNNKQYSTGNGTNWQTYTTDTFAVVGTGTAATNTITVASGSHTIILSNVNIDVADTGDPNSGTTGKSAFKIADNNTGDVTVILADGTENTLNSGNNCAGLQKNGDATNIGKLIITGDTDSTGALTATGGTQGAGIGGGYDAAGSSITITGGSVTATGGTQGAGIGGGDQAAGSNISITGGTVAATGGNNAAGIGGGNGAEGSSITITGGSVKAIAGKDANAIGGGFRIAAVTPKNGTQSDAENVYLTTITVQDASNDPVADTLLESLAVDGYTYGMKDVKTDTEGKIYVYLPAGKTVSQATSGTSDSTVNYYGSITAEADDSANGILSAATYDVTLPAPADQTGYTITAKDGNASPVVHAGSYTFTLTVLTGYHVDDVDDLVVKANDTELNATEVTVGSKYEYTISNINKAQQVTVEGVIANTYTVAYNANGGEGAMTDDTHIYDVEKALAANTFTNEGNIFTGWNTQADGTGTGYADAAKVKNLAADNNATVTLYAQWQEDPCQSLESCPLQQGTFHLYLNGIDMGEFTFADTGSGWTIFSEAEDKYLTQQKGVLEFTDQADSALWKYSRGCFYQTEKKAGGWWFGSHSKTTSYYLAAAADGSLTVSKSKKNAAAELYKNVSNASHNWSDWCSLGGGQHERCCLNCGCTEQEACEYSATDHKCALCGAYDPEFKNVEVTVKVSSHSTGWFLWKETYYTAHITPAAVGVTAEKVEYSPDNSSWQRGKSYTSRSPITRFYIRVTDSDNTVWNFEYADGVVSSK